MYLYLVLLPLISSLPLNPSRIILALNCGSGDVDVPSSDRSFRYLPDAPFVSKSVAVDYHSNDEVSSSDMKYTLQKSLYFYERHAYDKFTYLLPVKTGTITLILKFAEMYFKGRGERVFDIKVGKVTAVQDMDIIERTGEKLAAHEEYIEVLITSEGAVVRGQKVPLQNGKLPLTFSKGKADNPIVQGIIVYQGGIAESPKDEYDKLKANWHTQKEMQKAMKEEAQLRELLLLQKKKEKAVIRNDQLVIRQESKVTQKNSREYGVVRSIMMGYLGVVLWGVLFWYGYNVMKRKLFQIE